MTESKRESGYYWVRSYGPWFVCYYSNGYNKWRYKEDWIGGDNCFVEIDEKRVERQEDLTRL